MLVTSCSMFIGPPPGQQGSSAQGRKSQLHQDYVAWNRSVKNQKAQLVLPRDAKLWVRLPFDSGIATVEEGTHKVLHDLIVKYRALQALDAKRRAVQTLGERADQRHQFLFVQGFCDDEPIGGYDGSHIPPAHHYKSLLALSEARAVNVAEILMQSGIPHEEIQIQAFGATHFIARNASDSERQKNRRVDVYLVKR
ncbi:MAG: OmpA family protein [Mariprofundus sp.]|nr:OmpA family protein [Mariprofundus sp.]